MLSGRVAASLAPHKQHGNLHTCSESGQLACATVGDQDLQSAAADLQIHSGCLLWLDSSLAEHSMPDKLLTGSLYNRLSPCSMDARAAIET